MAHERIVSAPARREPRPPLVADLDVLRSVKVIGLGGIGGVVARYLVLYLAASGAPSRVTLVDGDRFEPDNAGRMLFSREGNKAAVVREDLLGLTEGSALTLVAVEEFATPENLARLVRRDDMVLLAVDNHATRKLVADHCATLDDVCLVSGGNDGVGADASGRPRRGTCGNVQVHRRRNGRDETPPLDAFHPEIATPRDRLPTEISCTDALVSVPQILFANLAAASAMLGTVFLAACDALDYPELCFDFERALMRPLPLRVPRTGESGRAG